MKTKWFIAAALIPFLSFSQSKKPCSCFNTIVSAGVVAGESAAKPLVQIEGGLNYHRYFTGIGVGLDPYYLKSIPLFADWRMSFDKAKLVFLYADGGYNFPYNNDKDDFSMPGYQNHYRGGFYMDAGLVYRIQLNSFHRLLLSTGYSRKHITNRSVNRICPFLPPCFEQVYNYHYNLGRIVTKLSWEFGRSR